MKASIFALAMLAVANASCPNQCSGHGWCDENDKCVCFRAPGTANQHLAYDGADCSQRVCPYGRTHDVITDSKQDLLPIWGSASSSIDEYVGFIPAPGSSPRDPSLKAFLNQGFLLERDYGIDIRIVSADVNQAKFQWKLSTEKTFRSEVTANVADELFTSRKLAYQIKVDDVESGLFIHFVPPLTNLVADDRYFLNVTFNDGHAYNRQDANSAHQIVECSGRGTCNRQTGQCGCSEGYTGDACQRTVCDNDCSGHGICQSQRYFVQDAYDGLPTAVTYDAFDADLSYGCKCDSGFRGTDCSQRECPSGPDPNGGDGGANGLDCSGRGLCDYTTGVCSCFKGFFGERCEEITTLI